MHPEHAVEKTPLSRREKKPYATPKLTAFGSVSSLTRSNNFTTCDDNVNPNSGCGDMLKPNMFTS